MYYLLENNAQFLDHEFVQNANDAMKKNDFKFFNKVFKVAHVLLHMYKFLISVYLNTGIFS